MIFLNPAVLFGLLAASIPVLIHLLNLKKLKRIDFSTLSFLKELQKNKIRKIKLKQWLLLALRVLIILFLVTAFARPTLEGVAIGGTTSAAKTTAVFILDNTFSMSVVDSKGSYFNQAKEIVNQLLKELQEGDEAALILVADRNDEVKPTNNLIDFSKAVNAAQMSFSSGKLNDAIIKAAKILVESKNFNKEIYLLSDFQKGKLSGNESLSDLSQLLNDKVRLYSFNLSGKEVFNIGIDNLKINTQIFEKEKPVSFSLGITNYSENPVENSVVSLYINGKRSAQQSVKLGGGESKIISMEAAVKETGFIDVYAEIEDDEIIQDNKRYTNLFIPDKIPIIIFADNPDDAQFVKLSLTASSNENTLNITEKNLNQIASFNLSQFDVVILIGAENSGVNERLKSYINSGGAIFLMPGAETSIQKFQILTNAIGVPSPTGTSGTKNNADNPVNFDKIDFNHPVFKNIFAEGEKKQIETPDVYFHLKISSEGKGKNIITLLDGTSFLSEYKIGEGKVFLMNIAPVLSWSNFPLKSIFAPLMNKSIYYLSSKDRIGTEYIAGNSVEINLENQNLPQIKIERPDNSEEFIKLDEQKVNNFIAYNKTDAAGNYKVISGKKIINEFSVNPDPGESVTKYLNDEDFRKYLEKINFSGSYINVKKSDNPSQIVLQARFGSELWKYFLIIALILALIEMAVARNAKKDLVEVQ